MLDLHDLNMSRLGWSSRTQFEETWATLLGVLVTQPITMDQEEETQQEVHTHTPHAATTAELITPVPA